MRRQTSLAAAMIAALSLVAVACGEKVPSGPEVVPPPGSTGGPVQIALSKNVDTLSVDEAIQLSAIVPPTPGAPTPSLSWSSSDSSVAIVSPNGVLFGRKSGKTIITVTSRGISDAATVTVRPSLRYVVFDADTLALGQGQSVTLPYHAVDSDGNPMDVRGRKIDWKSNAPQIADATGVSTVTGVTLGSTDVRLSIDGKSAAMFVRVKQPNISSVTINPSVVSVGIGQQSQLTATAADASGNVLSNRSVTFSSANPAIATITSSGLVTGVSAGTAKIVATADNKRGYATVAVAVPANVDTTVVTKAGSVSVTLNAGTLDVGQTTQATAVVKDSAGNVLTGRVVSWTSSDPSVASIDAAGVVTAVKAGSVVITGSVDGKAGDAVLAVSAPVLVPSTITVSTTKSTLLVGELTQATAVVKDANGTTISGAKVVWSSAPSTVATVSANGVALALSAGSASVTASVSNVTQSAPLTVLDSEPAAPAPVATVSVNLAATTIAVGATTQATATLRDAAGAVLTGRSIVWTSLSPTVATVSATGVVTAVSGGTSMIQATSEGQRGAATLTVSAPVVTPPPPATGRWVTGYWVGYQRALYPETAVDFSLMTHLIVGALGVSTSGKVTTDFFLDPTTGPQVARTLATRAHQAGRTALLMIGGAGQRDNLVGATAPATVNTTVTNLLATLDALGYDGLDVDWEPFYDSDKPQILALLQKLRAARPGLVLSFPIGWSNAFDGTGAWYATVAPLVDQLNIMSYEMAGNWGGWQSWHQAALTGEGGTHPTSIAVVVSKYRSWGIPAAKLGVGLGFYGSCWRGPTAPLQSPGSGVVASDNTMSYANIVASYAPKGTYAWDATAKAGYLSFAAATGPAGCTMISYEDERSIAEKGAYVQSQGLGGAMIWTIGQGHLPTAVNGTQDPLLQAAYQAVAP